VSTTGAAVVSNMSSFVFVCCHYQDHSYCSLSITTTTTVIDCITMMLTVSHLRNYTPNTIAVVFVIVLSCPLPLSFLMTHPHRCQHVVVSAPPSFQVNVTLQGVVATMGVLTLLPHDDAGELDNLF